MKKNLNNLSEIIAIANDLFYERNKRVDTLMGIMDKTLRKQGMNADAVTIDCVAVDKKIVFVLHDNKPDFIDIALGDKAGAINSSTSYSIAEVDSQKVLAIMEDYFLTSH